MTEAVHFSFIKILQTKHTLITLKEVVKHVKLCPEGH